MHVRVRTARYCVSYYILKQSDASRRWNWRETLQHNTGRYLWRWARTWWVERPSSQAGPSTRGGRRGRRLTGRRRRRGAALLALARPAPRGPATDWHASRCSPPRPPARPPANPPARRSPRAYRPRHMPPARRRPRAAAPRHLLHRYTHSHIARHRSATPPNRYAATPLRPLLPLVPRLRTHRTKARRFLATTNKPPKAHPRVLSFALCAHAHPERLLTSPAPRLFSPGEVNTLTSIGPG